MASAATASALSYQKTQAEVAQMRANVKNTQEMTRVNRQEVINRQKTGAKIDAETLATTQATATDLAREGDYVAGRDWKYQQGEESRARTKNYPDHAAQLRASAAQMSQAASATALRMEALRTKFAALLEEEKIDKSTYGEVLRWLGRLNPFSSSAKDLVPFIKGVK